MFTGDSDRIREAAKRVFDAGFERHVVRIVRGMRQGAEVLVFVPGYQEYEAVAQELARFANEVSEPPHGEAPSAQDENRSAD